MKRFEIPRKEPKKIIQEYKRRQGRSEASRQLTVSHTEALFKKYGKGGNASYVFLCPDCYTDEFIVSDNHTGEFVCTECGLVIECCGRIDQGIIPFGRFNNSKRYRTRNYARERISQINNRDPWIWNDEMEIIEESIKTIPKNIIERYGKLEFGRLCKKLPRPNDPTKTLGYRKYGERWIQIRIRLGLPMPFYYEMPPDYVLMLSDRTDIASDCYNDHFSGKTIDGIKFGKNIISTSYLFVQFLRMHDLYDDTWRIYINVSYSPNKLEEYNTKWKMMVEILKTHQKYQFYFEKGTEGDIISRRCYSWEYMPLKLHDIYHSQRFV